MPVKSLGIHEVSGAIVGDAKLEAAGVVSLAYDVDHNSIVISADQRRGTLWNTFVMPDPLVFAPGLESPAFTLT